MRTQMPSNGDTVVTPLHGDCEKLCGYFKHKTWKKYKISTL